MTKNEMINRLSFVLRALESTKVEGKQNLANMLGCIQHLEEIGAALSAVEFVDEEAEPTQHE